MKSMDPQLTRVGSKLNCNRGCHKVSACGLLVNKLLQQCFDTCAYDPAGEAAGDRLYYNRGAGEAIRQLHREPGAAHGQGRPGRGVPGRGVPGRGVPGRGLSGRGAPGMSQLPAGEPPGAERSRW